MPAKRRDGLNLHPCHQVWGPAPPAQLLPPGRPIEEPKANDVEQRHKTARTMRRLDKVPHATRQCRGLCNGGQNFGEREARDAVGSTAVCTTRSIGGTQHASSYLFSLTKTAVVNPATVAAPTLELKVDRRVQMSPEFCSTGCRCKCILCRLASVNVTG